MSWMDREDDWELRQKKRQLEETLEDREIGIIAQAQVLGELDKIKEQLGEKK